MCLGVPGKIVEVYEANGLRMAKIDFGGVSREACLAYLPETQVGDYVLIHVGFAMNKIDPAEARKALEGLQLMGNNDTEVDQWV